MGLMQAERESSNHSEAGVRILAKKGHQAESDVKNYRVFLAGAAEQSRADGQSEAVKEGPVQHKRKT